MAKMRIPLAAADMMVDEESGALLVEIPDVMPYTSGAPLAKDCTAADTDYTLSAQACRGVIVSAHPDNAGRLWVGVGAAAEDGKGTPLAAGDRVAYQVSNCNMIHVLAKSAGDDLCYNWVN